MKEPLCGKSLLLLLLLLLLLFIFLVRKQNGSWLLEMLSFFFPDLTDENHSLKNYIDRLMIVLMEKFPEVLENLGSSA